MNVHDLATDTWRDLPSRKKIKLEASTYLELQVRIVVGAMSSTLSTNGDATASSEASNSVLEQYYSSYETSTVCLCLSSTRAQRRTSAQVSSSDLELCGKALSKKGPHNLAKSSIRKLFDQNSRCQVLLCNRGYIKYVKRYMGGGVEQIEKYTFIK